MKKIILAFFLALTASVSAQDITFAGVSMHNKLSEFLYKLKNKGFEPIHDDGYSVSISGTFLDRQPDFFVVRATNEPLIHEICVGYGFITAREVSDFREKALKSLRETYSGFEYKYDESTPSDHLSGEGGSIDIYYQSKYSIASGDSIFPQDCEWTVMIYFHCNRHRHYYHYYVSDSVNRSVCVYGYEYNDYRFALNKTGAKDGHLVIPDTITINGIPYTVTTVGSWVHAVLSPYKFYKYPDLYSISLPNTVTEIGDRAFEFCANLEEITFGSGLKSIGDRAFNGCDKLKKINIPASLEHLESGLFSSCYSLESIHVEPGNRFYKSVDGILFSANGDTLMLMPRGFKSRSYTVPNGVKHIASNAILADSLEQITLPEGLVSIGDSAFMRLTKLRDISIPSSLRKLGHSSFNTCINLESISLPEGVDSIPQQCFLQCINLKRVSLPRSLRHIGQMAFVDCGVEELTLSEKVESIEAAAFANAFNLKSFTVAKGNPHFASRKGVLFTKDGSDLLAFPSAREGKYAVPKGVTGIESFAFFSSRLNSISFPKSLAFISRYAFYGCKSLIEVTIPHDVAIIGSNAFASCPNLRAIHLDIIPVLFAEDFAGDNDSIFFIPDKLYNKTKDSEEVKYLATQKIILRPESDYKASAKKRE